MQDNNPIASREPLVAEQNRHLGPIFISTFAWTRCSFCRHATTQK
jgi:hypothetical protein